MDSDYQRLMKPARPTGITILAILELIFGIIILIGGAAVAAVSGSGILSTLGYGYLSGMAAVAGGVLVVLGLVVLVVGWGMWTGKGWAWLLSVILYVLGILFGIASLASGSLTSIVGLLIEIFLLWYMFRPHVKAFFGRGPPSQPAPAMQPQSPPPTTT